MNLMFSISLNLCSLLYLRKKLIGSLNSLFNSSLKSRWFVRKRFRSFYFVHISKTNTNKCHIVFLVVLIFVKKIRKEQFFCLQEAPITFLPFSS